MNYLSVVLCLAWFSPILISAITLTHSPPLMTKQPTNGELYFHVSTKMDENNEPFIIACEAEGEPAPTYRWIKNGKNFSYETYDDRISQQPGRGTLVIKSPRDEDIGQYQCFADNEFGTATSNSVFLRKAELNSFKSAPPESAIAREGEPFKLSCQPPDGTPKPIVSWVTQGADQSIRAINNSRLTVDPEGNLWFSNVTRQDASVDSEYACTAVSLLRLEYKLGNKVVLTVQSPGPSRFIAPVAQYLTEKNQVAYRGETATMYCIYGGTPLPEIKWLKNGQVLRGAGRVFRGNYGKSLIIKYVTSEDEGDYQCEVTNGVGEAKSHTINLKVLAKPYFIEEPQIENRTVDEIAEFHCNASGNPEPQIIWIYNGKPISEAPINPRRTVKTNSIVIEKLQKSDTGNYGCNATNSIGYVYKDVYLNVLALAPEIIEKPRDEVTVESSTFTMTCRVLGSPKPAVKWMRNGVELTGGRYTTLPTGDLQISKVSLSDSGNYTCFAQNKIGNDTAAGSLTVKHRTQISEGPIDCEVQAGSPATFRCSAHTDPDLTRNVDWLRNGEEINFEIEPRFVKFPDSSLIITKTKMQDSGEYTCRASTVLDEAVAKAILVVQDVPNAPQLNRNVECKAAEATLGWTPMGDNRAPILNYVVQYNTSFTPDSWDVALPSVPASESRCTFPLTPWANFTFRVLARNKIGLSPPSEHSFVCRTDEDIPYKNPSNVMAQGTEHTNLVISWTPMPQIEHHGPMFHYEVFWRIAALGNSFTSQKITSWETSEYVVHNVPTFIQYEVKVTANNIRGQAREPAKSVFGYSGKDCGCCI